MAVIASARTTLLDITSRLAPDGKQAKVAEILTQEHPLLEHMPWKEGNLTTGHRVTQRASLPSVGFRRLYEGVARSKTTTRQLDEAAAMLEANTVLDRKIAVLNPGKLPDIMADNDKAFVEAMGQRMISTFFYGNALTAPKEFNGVTMRYNSLSGPNANQIIDAGGSSTNNNSIWLVGWGDNSVYGIYPKGSVGGLQHMNTTSNMTMQSDGVPTGDETLDANGNPYLVLKGHYEWNCGLAVEDPRYIVRAANISKSLLTKDYSTGADLADIMIQMIHRIHRITPATAFYMSRATMSFMERQGLFEKRAFENRQDGPVNAAVAVQYFHGIPVYRTDALIGDEARVV